MPQQHQARRGAVVGHVVHCIHQLCVLFGRCPFRGLRRLRFEGREEHSVDGGSRNDLAVCPVRQGSFLQFVFVGGVVAQGGGPGDLGGSGVGNLEVRGGLEQGVVAVGPLLLLLLLV